MNSRIHLLKHKKLLVLKLKCKEWINKPSGKTARARVLSELLFLFDKYECESLLPWTEKYYKYFFGSWCEFLTIHPQKIVNRNIIFGFPSSSLQLSKFVYTWHLWQKSLAFHFIYMKHQPLLPAAVLTSVQMHSIKSTREQCLIYNNIKVL